VPGIGTIQGSCARIHAIATWADVTFFRSANPGHEVDERLVHLACLALEPGDGCAEVAGIELGARVDRAGQEALARAG
jgi:hypothetical protein